MVPRSREREHLGTDLYAGGTLFHAHGGLDPPKRAAELMHAAVRAGALVRGDTPVTGVRRAGLA